MGECTKMKQKKHLQNINFRPLPGFPGFTIPNPTQGKTSENTPEKPEMVGNFLFIFKLTTQTYTKSFFGQLLRCGVLV